MERILDVYPKDPQIKLQWNHLVMWVFSHPKTSSKISTLQTVTWVCPKIICGLQMSSYFSTSINSILSKNGLHQSYKCRTVLANYFSYQYVIQYKLSLWNLLDHGLYQVSWGNRLFWLVNRNWPSTNNCLLWTPSLKSQPHAAPSILVLASWSLQSTREVVAAIFVCFSKKEMLLGKEIM